MTPRERHVLGPADQPCDLCGHRKVVLIESRNVRQLRHRFNPSWDPEVRVTKACSHCGARAIAVNIATAS